MYTLMKLTLTPWPRCLRMARGGSHFNVCWAGKLVVGDHVTGFLIVAAVGAASGFIGDAKADRCALSGGSKCTEARYVRAASNPVCCNHL
jgi:hypothetical protein